jgi:hypothetical protein
MATNYPENKRQFALDIFDADLRQQNAHLLPNGSLSYSFGGYMILGSGENIYSKLLTI